MPATDNLIAGYQRFRDGYYQQNKESLLELAKGQSPKIAIVSCCDSRVDPAVILDCDPGDLFVIRNVANLVPPCESDDGLHGTSAALEFAVTGLGVESIIVLGHTQCGGIKALMDTPQVSTSTSTPTSASTPTSNSFISQWMKQLDSVRKGILADEKYTSQKQRYDVCEREGISQSLENLMTFPWISERVTQGDLKLHGWIYDLGDAELFSLDNDIGVFKKVS